MWDKTVRNRAYAVAGAASFLTHSVFGAPHMQAFVRHQKLGSCLKDGSKTDYAGPKSPR